MDKLGSRAIVGIGAKFSGKISGAQSIEINGNVVADLVADKVTIGASGKFEGVINADLAVISGEYDGAMEAGSVWATKTARISGKVQYKTLQMDRGAALNCHVIHNWVEEVGPKESEKQGTKTKQVDAKDNKSMDDLNDQADIKAEKSVAKKEAK